MNPPKNDKAAVRGLTQQPGFDPDINNNLPDPIERLYIESPNIGLNEFRDRILSMTHHKLANEGELREKLMKSVRVIKGHPSSGSAMQFHVPDTPDGENYIFQIDEEFWQEIVKEVEKAKVEAENNNPWRSTKEAMPNEGDFVLARLEYPSGKETHAILEHKTLEDNQPWLADGCELDFQMSVTHWRYIEELSKLQEEQ